MNNENENKAVLSSSYGEMKNSPYANGQLEIMNAISNLENAIEVFSKYRYEYLANAMCSSDDWRVLYNKVYDLSSELWRVQNAAEEKEERENEEEYDRGR